MTPYPSDVRLARAMAHGHEAARDGAGFRVDCGDGVTRWAREEEYQTACGLVLGRLRPSGGVGVTPAQERAA
jgi:hypothetical protein